MEPAVTTGVSKAPREANPDLSVEDVTWNFKEELKVSSSAAKTLKCSGFQACMGLGSEGAEAGRPGTPSARVPR